MMSFDMNEIAEEFLVIKDFFDKIGFEVVGTKDINNEILYVVRKKKINEFSLQVLLLFLLNPLIEV